VPEDAALQPLVAVVGPTGSGKSELALRLAEEWAGEIVNCDSLQLYRHLDIGTAKPPVSERRGIPHHLFDLLDPNQVFTAGEYARAARPLLAGIAGRGHLPIVAGGTGLYLRALIEGLFPGPRRDERLRARLARREATRPGWLHSLLARFDTLSAARIHPGDVQKLIRAVEVLLVTRRPLSSWWTGRQDPLAGFRVLKLGLDPPREELYARLDERLVRMFDAGLVNEVRHVLALGFAPSSKALEAHGYKQALMVLNGELDPDAALVLAQRNTRRYAKRQWTWFRGDPEVKWLHGFGQSPEVQREALTRVAEFLGSWPATGA
jgi:tRNA dimethylallyltransferase